MTSLRRMHAQRTSLCVWRDLYDRSPRGGVRSTAGRGDDSPPQTNAGGFFRWKSVAAWKACATARIFSSW